MSTNGDGEFAPGKSALKPAWQPGQSGNPTGRPKGGRNKLSEAFIRALCSDFEDHGAEVIERVRIESPADYLKVIAKLVPREFSVTDGGFDDLTSPELTLAISVLRERLRSTVPQ